MEKDFRKMWGEMREVAEAGAKAKYDDGKISSVLIGGVAQTVYGVVLKEMDRIERGYAECDKCGCRMEKVESTVCEECAKKMLEGSAFKDLLDL